MGRNLVVLLGLSFTLGCSSEPPNYATQLEAVAKSQAALELNYATVKKTLCTMQCESQYRSCTQFRIESDIAKHFGIDPDRGPGKIELPGCWPYGCSDEEQKVAIESPRLSCQKIRETCLEACQ